MMRFAFGLTILGAMVAHTVTATAGDADKDSGVVHLQSAPTALDPDFAYLLMRVSTAKSGLFPIQQVLLRIPSTEEMYTYLAAKRAAYDAALPALTKKAKGNSIATIDEFAFDYKGKANSFVVEGSKFIEDGSMRTTLVQVPVGTYILYGITLGNRGLVTCNCLGTVRFAASAGMITDLGSLYADKVHKTSPIPHLEDNLGEKMFQYGFVFGAALRPADATTSVPTTLRLLPIKRAVFEIVGQYYEPGASGINRLAPIPGLLRYEHGKPVDARTDKHGE